MHISWLFQRLKTTTKWKKLTTWWPWAHSPQTFWQLRIDANHPAISTSNRELCTSWSHILGRPSLTWPSNMPCQNFSGSSGCFEHEPSILAQPWDKRSSVKLQCFNLFSLTVCWEVPLVAPQWRIHLKCRRPEFDPQVRKIPWKRKWQPTPVFLTGKSHGQRNLASYSSWSHKSQTWLSDYTATTVCWAHELVLGNISPHIYLIAKNIYYSLDMN